MNPTVKLVVILVTTTVLAGGASVLIWFIAKFTFGNKCAKWQTLNSRNMCVDKTCTNDPKSSGHYELSHATGNCECQNPTEGGCGCPKGELPLKTSDGTIKCYAPCKGDLKRNSDGECVCEGGVPCNQDKSTCCVSQASCVTNQDGTASCCPKERWTGTKCCAIGEIADGDSCVSVCGNTKCKPDQTCVIVSGPGGEKQKDWETNIESELAKHAGGDSGGIVGQDAFFCFDESGCVFDSPSFFPPELNVEETSDGKTFYPYYKIPANTVPFTSGSSGGVPQICMPKKQYDWVAGEDADKTKVANQKLCIRKSGTDCENDESCKVVDLAKVLSHTGSTERLDLFNTMQDNHTGHQTSELGAYCYEPDSSGSYYRAIIDEPTGASAGKCGWKDCVARNPESHGMRVQWVDKEEGGGNTAMCVAFPLPGEEQTFVQKFTCSADDKNQVGCCTPSDKGKTVECVRCLNKNVPCDTCKDGTGWVKKDNSCKMPTKFPECTSLGISDKLPCWKDMEDQYVAPNRLPVAGSKRMLSTNDGGQCPLKIKTSPDTCDLQLCGSPTAESSDEPTCKTLKEKSESAWINTATAARPPDGSSKLATGPVCDDTGQFQTYEHESKEARATRMCKAFNSYLDVKRGNDKTKDPKKWFTADCDNLVAGTDGTSKTKFAIRGAYQNLTFTDAKAMGVPWCGSNFSEGRCVGHGQSGNILVDPTVVDDWADVATDLPPGVTSSDEKELVERILSWNNSAPIEGTPGDQTAPEKKYGISWPDGDCNVACDLMDPVTADGEQSCMDCVTQRIPPVQGDISSTSTSGMVAGLYPVSYSGGEQYVVYSDCSWPFAGEKQPCGYALWGNQVRKDQYGGHSVKPPMYYGKSRPANIYSTKPTVSGPGGHSTEWCSFSDPDNLGTCPGAHDAAQSMCHNFYFPGKDAPPTAQSWNHSSDFGGNDTDLGTGGICGSSGVNGSDTCSKAYDGKYPNVWGGPWNTVLWGQLPPADCKYQCPADNPAVFVAGGTEAKICHHDAFDGSTIGGANGYCGKAFNS